MLCLDANQLGLSVANTVHEQARALHKIQWWTWGLALDRGKRCQRDGLVGQCWQPALGLQGFICDSNTASAQHECFSVLTEHATFSQTMTVLAGPCKPGAHVQDRRQFNIDRSHFIYQMCRIQSGISTGVEDHTEFCLAVSAGAEWTAGSTCHQSMPPTISSHACVYEYCSIPKEHVLDVLSLLAQPQAPPESACVSDSLVPMQDAPCRMRPGTASKKATPTKSKSHCS